MTRFARILGIAVLLAGFAVALQSFATDKQVTLTGTISDSMCGAKHMMSGDDAKCTRTCVRNGSQYVLVARDKVYTLDGKAEELDSLAGQSVIVVGGLTGDALKVASVKANQVTQGVVERTEKTGPPRNVRVNSINS